MFGLPVACKRSIVSGRFPSLIAIVLSFTGLSENY